MFRSFLNLLQSTYLVEISSINLITISRSNPSGYLDSICFSLYWKKYSPETLLESRFKYTVMMSNLIPEAAKQFVDC